MPAHAPLNTERPPIAAILFDLDDTLWPITPVIVRAEQVLFDWIRTHAAAVAKQYSIDSMRARRSELMREYPALRADLVALRHQIGAQCRMLAHQLGSARPHGFDAVPLGDCSRMLSLIHI